MSGVDIYVCVRQGCFILNRKVLHFGMEAQPGEEEGLGTFDPFLLLEIFGYIDWEHAPVLSLVNKHWASVVNDILLSSAHLWVLWPSPSGWA